MEWRNYTGIAVLMAFMLLGATPLSEAYDFIGSPSHRLRTITESDDESPVEELGRSESERGREPAPEKESPGPVEEETDPAVDTFDLIKDEKEEVTVENIKRSVAEATEELAAQDIEKSTVEDTEEVTVENTEELIVDAPEVEDAPPIEKAETLVLPEPTDVPAQEKNLDYYEVAYETLSGGNVWDKLPPSKSGNYVLVYRSSNCIYCDKLITELKGNTGDYVLVAVSCSGSVKDLLYSRWVVTFPSYLIIKNKRVSYYGYGYYPLEKFKGYLK